MNLDKPITMKLTPMKTKKQPFKNKNKKKLKIVDNYLSYKILCSYMAFLAKFDHEHSSSRVFMVKFDHRNLKI